LIKAWRLVRKKRLAEAFSGEGARLGGGRWNHVGIPVVYVSVTLSLAALELFIHFTRKDIRMSKSLLAIPVEIPDALRVTEILVKNLKPGWDSSPPPDFTKELGTEWVKEGASAILRVPSAIIPEEHNLVINPKHKDFSKIIIRDPRPFALDNRVWK
jgi:RES domain-containing protein